MKVFLMSGLPGSGKSTLAREIAVKHSAEVVSADDFFMTLGGEYVFAPERLGAAHASCMRRFIGALALGKSVIVDNTNTTVLELAPYVAVAAAYGAKVEILNVRGDIETCVRRNTHGVPRHAIERMAANLEARELPCFWEVEEK